MGIIFKVVIGGLILPGIIFIRFMWTIRIPILNGKKIYESLDKIRSLDDEGKKEAVFERMLDENERIIVTYSILVWILIALILL